MLIDLIIKLLKDAVSGFKIKKVGVGKKQKTLVSGTIKLKNQTTISIVCEYKDGDVQHKLEAVNKKGDDNDTVQIDGVVKTNVKISHKPVKNAETPVKTIVEYEGGDSISLYWSPV